MLLVRPLYWEFFLTLTLFIVTGALSVSDEDEHSEHHTLRKRAESHVETDFMQKTITVNENVGILINTVCVKGGLNKRSFSLFSARGPADQCYRGPCPDATEDVDFVRVYVEEFLVDPGELLCFNITILDDTLVEGREFFSLGILDLRWGEVLSTASVTIIDNDSPSLDSNRGVTLESVGEFEFCLTGGIIDVPLVVQVENTADLVEMTEFFTISPDEMVCVNVTIVDDKLYEGLEIVEVLVRSANTSIGNFSESFLLHIFDNDETPRFEQSTYTVDEDDGELEVCVFFPTDPSDSVDSTLIISDGSAKKGSDFVANDQSFPINGEERKCVSITIIDDENPERVERLFVSLNSSNLEGQGPFQATIIIQDNDVITFQESVYSTVEGELGVEVCVLLPSQGQTKNGRLSTVSGTATERLDFFPLLHAAFNITGSEKRCFFIYNYRDFLEEGQEEFSVRVYTLLTPELAIDFRTARIILEDDDSSPCGNLTKPANGRIVTFTNGNRPGSEVIYACNFGFQLVGLEGNGRTCMPSGEWEGQDPSCIEIMCPMLNDPIKGKVAVSGRTVNSVATYTCDSGYALEGVMQRFCLPSVGGVWSGNAPKCELIVCPLLPPPANGTVVLPDVRVPGSVVKYTCLSDFLLFGVSERICLDNGTWNGTDPTCISALNADEPLGLKLVNNTPKINGTTVIVDITVDGPVNKVTCTLDNKVVEEDFQSRTKGGMNFTNVPPGGHTLEMVVSSLVTEERAYVRRFFETSTDLSFCGLHLINEGMVVNSHELWVEFAAVPTSKSYRCKLDRQPGFECISPVRMSGLVPGHHRLKIMHHKDECGYRRKIFLHFDIEDTPDNPQNNL